MTKLTMENYVELVEAYRGDYVTTVLAGLYGKSYDYVGEVVPKQRPRVGKGGRMYTPPETVKFERAIAKWGKAQGMVPVHFPLEVSIAVSDQTDDETLVEHSTSGLVFNTKRDLDNQVKAILDGLNKVAYADDRQIVRLHASRAYDTQPGFTIMLIRAGLSANEYEQFKKVAR